MAMAGAPKRRPAKRRPERPRDFAESGLDDLREPLVKRLLAAQKGFTGLMPRFRLAELRLLATTLLEFAVDLRSDVGIWRALEEFQTRTFGTPLPFFAPVGADREGAEVTPARARSFLWGLHGQTIPGFAFEFAPDDPDLARFADAAAEALRDLLGGTSRRSLAKEFLDQPITYGWDVKEKLIWLGTRSYLFRDLLTLYLARRDPKAATEGSQAAIPLIDDFLSEACTGWAGLGAIDVLAGLLPLDPARRADLLAWSERHLAVYEVREAAPGRLRVRNLINDAEYVVRMNVPVDPFCVGHCVGGSLVPWAGEWYWSGTQQVLGHVGKADERRLKESFRGTPSAYYRLRPDELARARELTRQMHDRFVARHGRDWAVFDDGRALAADWRAEAEQAAAAAPGPRRRRPPPPVAIPPDLAATTAPIGVYSNPAEGQELVEEFADVLAALRKRGAELAGDEADALRGLLVGPDVSPGFVRALADEFGAGSFLRACAIADPAPPYALGYLLRRHKGQYDRPRYPTLTIADA